MSTIDLDLTNDANNETVSMDQWNEVRAHRCHLLIVEDEDGYSAIAMNLPGAGSCGDTVDEAIANATEAVVAVIGTHLEAGESIPWIDSSDQEIPSGSQQRWVIVNAKGSED